MFSLLAIIITTHIVSIKTWNSLLRDFYDDVIFTPQAVIAFQRACILTADTSITEVNGLKMTTDYANDKNKWLPLPYLHVYTKVCETEWK